MSDFQLDPIQETWRSKVTPTEKRSNKSQEAESPGINVYHRVEGTVGSRPQQQRGVFKGTPFKKAKDVNCSL